MARLLDFHHQQAPRGGGWSASPLGQGEPLDVSSSPHSYRMRPSAAAAKMTLTWCREAMTRTTPTCAPIYRRVGYVAAPGRLWQWIFIGGDATLPRLPPLDAVVVPIVLGDLTLLVLRLACSTLPLRNCLVPVEYRLLQERRLGRNEVGTLQLRQRAGRGVIQSGRSLRTLTSQQKTQNKQDVSERQ
jgi:hypothetical protein